MNHPCLCLLEGALLIALPLQAQVQTEESAARWRADLDFLTRTMRATHPNLFARVDSESFDAAAAALRDQIPALSSEQIITGLMTIAALPRDAHTGLYPFGPESRFFPLHLYVFSDGVFVVNARPPYEGLIGKQMIA